MRCPVDCPRIMLYSSQWERHAKRMRVFALPFDPGCTPVKEAEVDGSDIRLILEACSIGDDDNDNNNNTNTSKNSNHIK